MRITIVQGPFLPVPPLLGGAVERSMQTLGRHWAAAGCKVTHISRRFPGLDEEEIQAGVQHRRIRGGDAPKNPLLFRLRELGYVRRAIAALPPGDIVVSNSVLLPMLLRSRRFGRLVPQMQRPPKGQLRFYRHVDRVQTISREMQRRILAEAPWLEGRVSVVGSPLDGPLAPLPSGAELPERERLITYVGRLHAEKGLELLLQAFLTTAPHAADWRLQLIGPAEVKAGGSGEAYRGRLERLAARLPQRIVLRPPIFDPAVLAEELRRSAIFAYPSLAEQGEALGLAPLEAAGQGAVPLVSALACFEDFVGDGTSGAVFDHRAADPVAALAARMASLMRDRETLRRLGAGAIAAASAYAAPLVARRHLEDFENLLRATAAARS